MKNLRGDPTITLTGTAHSGAPRHPAGFPPLVPIDIGEAGAALRTIGSTAPDVIVHCIVDRARGFDGQLEFDRALAVYASHHGCLIYFCSSGNAVVSTRRGPFDEDCPLAPDCEYGAYKANCERLYQSCIPGRVCILRLPQVWGPNTRHLSRLIAETNGDLMRSLGLTVTADEVVDACSMAGRNPAPMDQ